MHPLEFIQTCDRLFAVNPREEADNRTILSRLYYAFFLTLRDGIKDQGFRGSLRNGGPDHTLVRDYLKGDRFRVSGERISGRAGRVGWYERYYALFKAREIADYQLDIAAAEIAETVEELLYDAKDLRPYIEAYVR